MHLTLAFILLALPLVAPQGGGVPIRDGFLTGTKYRGLPEAQRRSYVMGAIDGMLVSPLLGAPKGKLAWLEQCIDGMNDEQVAAIVTKFVAAHPERWHEAMHAQVFLAFSESCPGSPAAKGK